MSLALLISDLQKLQPLTEALPEKIRKCEEVGIIVSGVGNRLDRMYYNPDLSQEDRVKKALTTIKTASSLLRSRAHFYNPSAVESFGVGLTQLSKDIKTCKRFSPKTGSDKWMFI